MPGMGEVCFAALLVLPLKHISCTPFSILQQSKCRLDVRQCQKSRPGHRMCAVYQQSGKFKESLSESQALLSSPERSCGFTALLGPSNSGKSTLLNLLVGQKVAIVTPKVQTTRCRIAGIVTNGNVMTVFLDTPGVFHGKGRLDRAMVRAAWSSASGADVVAVVVDAAELYHGGRRRNDAQNPLYISEALEDVLSRSPRGLLESCVCLNKVDAIPEGEVAGFLCSFRKVLAKFGVPSDVTLFPMSARHDSGVAEFVSWASERMPPGPWLYPEDDLTDMPMRLIASEVTREKAFLLLKHELPYEMAVETTSYKDGSDGSVRITQDILVGRDSHKGMVTGKGGAMVKAIGTLAREELCEMLETRVHLMLTVKIQKNWKEISNNYGQWGLEFNV